MAKPERTADWSRRLAFPGIVASCRIRLARNLRGERFPEHLPAPERQRLRDRMCDTLTSIASLRDDTLIRIESASPQALLQLREQQLISSELSERGDGGAVILNREHSRSIMVNEEDHLRIQILRDGADLRTAWKRADAMDRELEQHFDFAFDPEIGYLTACPSNVGTGLRASVMLHLLGLRLTNEIEPVFKALNRLGVEVRGFWGEGSEAAGHLYQISNQQTLGETEGDILGRLSDVAAETARQEQNARMRLIEDRPEVMLDCLARSLAVLRHARVLYSEEALDFLTAIRMGIDAGLVRGMDPALLEYWKSAVLPGHLQTLAKGVLEADARDRVRADLMRRALDNVELVE